MLKETGLAYHWFVCMCVCLLTCMCTRVKARLHVDTCVGQRSRLSFFLSCSPLTFKTSFKSHPFGSTGQESSRLCFPNSRTIKVYCQSWLSAWELNSGSYACRADALLTDIISSSISVQYVEHSRRSGKDTLKSYHRKADSGTGGSSISQIDGRLRF